MQARNDMALGFGCMFTTYHEFTSDPTCMNLRVFTMNLGLNLDYI